MKSDSLSEKQSAEKRARREKPWSFPVVLLFCALFCSAGALYLYWFYLPHGCSEDEVLEYVRSVYGETWKLEEKDQYAGEEGTVYYRFADGQKNSFRVFSTAVPEERGGLPTGRWKKALYDDYFSSVVRSRLQELEQLARKTRKKTGVELELERLVKSDAASKTHAPEDPGEMPAGQLSFRLYLDSSDQLADAAGCIRSMDELLAFSIGGDGEQAALRKKEVPAVHVYLCPEKERETPDAVSGAEKKSAGKNAADPQYPQLASWTGNWRDPFVRVRYEISTIPFTCGADGKRYKKGELFARLENDFADAARSFGKEYYTITEELEAKYPAPFLTLVNAGGHDLAFGKNEHEYRLYYSRRTGTYWMTDLDPCEKEGGNGSFSALVRYLGGYYENGSGRRREACWRIGANSWKASLTTKKGRGEERVYGSMRVYRNGNSLPLDPVPEGFEGTGALPSGRPFSLHDLIRLLNVHITVNQSQMTAVMYRTNLK